MFPEEVDDKSVTQLDVNESSVRSNRSLHPKSRVVQGNYLDLDKSGQFDLITGLSSLDSTIFIDRVIEQIRDALRQGGFLFHVQDVLPGATIPRIEMLREGHSQPLIAEYPRQLASANLLDRLSQVTSYWSAREGCFLSSVELFRRHLAAAIKRVEGMEIVFDDWLTACNPNNPDKRGVLYSGIASNYGHFKPDSQMASAAVTVVKKL